MSGGGRASGRETVARVIGGAFAMLFLQQYDISIRAFTLRIGPHAIQQPVSSIDPDQPLRSPLECPDEKLSEAMETYLETLRQEGDTTGGVVGCIIRGLPPGLGEPVFDKLHTDLGKATLSIGACKGFEIGSGFDSAAMKGSLHNDPFVVSGGKVITSTNHSGGIQGGISNGMDIWFRAAFKPVPSIGLKQLTLDRDGHEVEIKIHGRHDVCVIPRVLPVVEAMSALVLADHMLRQRSTRV